MPMIPLIIGAGMGLLNASEQDKQASEARKVAAATIAYSPYTGASIGEAQKSIHPAKYLASTGAGALGGLAAYQGNAAAALGGSNTNVSVNTASPEQLGAMQGAYQQLRRNTGAAPQNPFDVNPAGSPGQADPNYYGGGMMSPYQRAMRSYGGS